jgi:hypothetical protein
MEEFVKGQPTYLFEQVLSFNPFEKKREIEDIRFGAVAPKKRKKLRNLV